MKIKELLESFKYDVDHMPGRTVSLSSLNKTKKIKVATNSVNGHKQHEVEVDATSENHAKNLAAKHFTDSGLVYGKHFEGVRIIK